VVVKAATAEQDEEPARIRTEAELLASLGDSAATSCLPVLVARGEAAGWTWFATDSAGPRTLLEARLQTLAELIDLLEACGTALRALHARGIVHLDAAPRNIVLGPGRVTLVDLGDAQPVGTPLAARPRAWPDGDAPERTSARLAEPAIDLYELAHGVGSAWCGGSDWTVQHLHGALVEGAADAADLWRRAALAALLVRCRDHDPRVRPSAGELVLRVRAIRRGPPPRWASAGGGLVAGALLAGFAAATLWVCLGEPAIVAFEDATGPWELGTAAPDAAAGGSGYLGTPAILPVDGTLAVVVPRAARAWGSPSATRRGVLVSALDPHIHWAVRDLLPGVADPAWIQPADLDGDGEMDLVVGEAGPPGLRVRALRGPAWNEHFDGLPDADAHAIAVPGHGRTPDRLVWHDGELAIRQWSEGQWIARIALGDPGPAVAWADLDDDGFAEVLTADADGVSVLAESPAGEWVSRPVAALPIQPSPHTAPGARMAFGDLDGDGDEDGATIRAGSGEIVAWYDEGRQLFPRTVGLRVLDPDERTLEFATSVVLADLDADGRAEIIVPSQGFVRSGAQRAKIWSPRPDGSFARIAAPPELSAPHDGSRPLVVDLDADGRPDLLDLSINDRALEMPDHRAWRTLVPARSTPLALDLETGAPLPVGTRVSAVRPRPWVAVKRDEQPIYVPTWVEEIAVHTPAGRIYAAQRGPEGFVGHLAAPGEIRCTDAHGDPIAPGEVAPTGVLFRHRTGSIDVVALFGDASSRLQVTTGRGASTTAVGPLVAGIGCGPRGDCLMLEQQPGGGHRPLLVAAESGALVRPDQLGDFADAWIRDGDEAWSSRAGRITRRDPATYAPLGASDEISGARCTSLGVSPSHLACAAVDPVRLFLLDRTALTLARTLVLAPGATHAWVVPADDGWAVATDVGIWFLDASGRVTASNTWSGTRRLEARPGAVVAIGAHTALWFDARDGRALGGVRIRGLGDGWVACDRAEP
jgi:hypothetical protein